MKEGENMTDKQLLSKMIADYQNKKQDYHVMSRYYKGDHDINYHYNKFPNRANQVVIDNYINKFINEEVQYSLGNPISYVSLSGNDEIIDKIFQNLYHWKDNHNQELMRNLEIYGKAYLLHYVDAKGRFSERILNPENAIVYRNSDGIPVRFIHFYKKKYEDCEYRDVYYPDGKICIYRDNTLIEKKTNFFNGIPVSICELENIEDTIFCKIKKLQDAYNEILSDQVNTISDYRRAYLVISGVQVDENTTGMMQKHGLLNLPSVSNTTAKWLVKDMPDIYIENNLKRIRSAMYETCNHIDGNEKLQSNTSGTALRNRLVFLEQRCNLMLNIVINSMYDRLERLFEYLAVKGKAYPLPDIKIVATPSIPQDKISIIQALSQLGIGDHISLETALSRIPFIENPQNEIAKIKAERKDNQQIELDKIEDLGDGLNE